MAQAIGAALRDGVLPEQLKRKGVIACGRRCLNETGVNDLIACVDERVLAGHIRIGPADGAGARTLIITINQKTKIAFASTKAKKK